jgi:dihydrofolate synthase/folylpolyglutamate synthase
MDLSLNRIGQLLHSFENPQDNHYKIIHVAGTNGKGSTCAYITSVLVTAGYNVGTFNSPHLLEPRDSIQINGKPVTQNEFDMAYETIYQKDQELNSKCTSFELLTAVAYWIFRKRAVQLAVVEVGLGGRLDATNVHRSSLVSVITSIGMDHMAQLGNSISQIASEKAGIMRQNGIVVVAPQKYDEATLVFEQQSQRLNCRLIKVKAATLVPSINSSNENWAIVQLTSNESNIREMKYPLSMPGSFQLENSATAMVALDIIRAQFPMTDEQIIKGMGSTYWRGRLDWQLVPGIGKVLVDGAHNPDAAKLLRQYVDSQVDHSEVESINWIFGATEGKDIEKILSELVKNGDQLYTVPFTPPSGMPWIKCYTGQKIKSILEQNSLQAKVFICDNLTHAFDQVKQQNISKKLLIVVCGSLYLVSDFFRAFKGEMTPKV